MVLAAVGTLCSTVNIAKNLSICQSIIKRAAAEGARLIYLPEASDFICVQGDVAAYSKPLYASVFLEGIRKSAREHSIYVGVGIHELTSLDPKKCMNANILIDSKGEIVQVYHKVHLFDVTIPGGLHIQESKTTIRGDYILKPSETPCGKIGLLTCYDLRFPEVSTMLRQAGAEIICYPSAFTLKTGAAHWEVLLRARAIETQCYILAPAQSGMHSPDRSSYGHSMIIDPWGIILGQDKSESEEGSYIMADINLGYLKNLRDEIPLQSQRRFDIYPKLEAKGI